MFLRVSVVAALVLPGAFSCASAQSNTFELQSGGKVIGKDVYTLAKAKQGYKLSSRVGYHLAGAETDTIDDFRLSEEYAYQDGGASSLASQMRTSFTPNKPRTMLTIGMVQAGVQDSRQLAIKPDFAILPSYDAGAAQAFLLEAVLHPVASNLYNVVVPGGSAAGPRPGDTGADPTAGRGAATVAQSGNQAYDTVWTKGADTSGSLDGKPVALHSYSLASTRGTWTFYADDANMLMQVDASMTHSSAVRAKFKLDAAK